MKGPRLIKLNWRWIPISGTRRGGGEEEGGRGGEVEGGEGTEAELDVEGEEGTEDEREDEGESEDC